MSSGRSERYDVVITTRDDWAGLDYHVKIRRRSDGKELVRIYEWKILAKLFTRSPRRIARAFRSLERWERDKTERFTVSDA